MAESGEVRLVRCPKCENLLPELPDYSVYQCGGCGAVLRAKKSDLDGVRVSADDARLGILSEKSDSFSGKPENSPAKPAVTLLRTRQGGVGDSDRRISKVVAERLGSNSNETAENWGIENGEMGELGNERLKSSDIHQSKIAGIKSVKQKVPERGEMDGFGRLGNGGGANNGGGRFQPQSHVGEGTSRSYANGNLRSTAAARNPIESNECAEPGREELLRRLEELKQQLSQSCDVNGKPEAKPPLGSRMFGRPEPYADPDGWLYDHPSWYQREPESRSRYCNYYQEPLSALDRYENSHLSALDLSRVSGCENSFGPPLARRLLPHRKPGCFQNTRSHPYLPGHYPCPEPTPFERDQVDNQFPCSCYHCYHKQSQMPSSAYRRYPLAPNNPLPHHPENHRAFSPHGGYNSRISHLHPHVSPCDPHPPLRNRWPNDVNLESRGVAFSRPQRMSLASRGRPCQPIAGGAPFITCHNCLELLELPKKVSQLDKSKLKICCGGCSSVISFTLVDEKLFPVELPVKENVVDDLDSSDEVMHAKPYDPHSGLRQDNAGFHSEDRDNTNYDVQTMDKELVSSSTAQGCNLTKSEEVQNLQLSSSSTSEDGDNNGNLVVANGVKSDRQSPVKTVLSPSAPGSPLQEQFDYSSLKYRAVNRCPKGSLSSRSDQERVVSGKTCLRQNSLKESLGTEMEVCANDCTNAAVSQDNGNIYKEVEQPKCKKGVDSFLAGIIKKSFRDFSKSNHSLENRKRNVTVNGHLIADRSVKKAEKLAGPVSPGHYWYDYRAGFWGVMGGPGLGIIPPHIEEFNYRMPDKCAGGNTDIFVNGRELHQKDLDLLASRGLPATKYRSYIVEISGRVVDEDSNEELDGLGKLAPTIEKVKHGFGMRDPKDSAKLT